MKLDAWRNIRLAKASFRRKIHNLGRVVAKNDRAAEKKIAKLTGVVKSNAEKSAAGRKKIAILERETNASVDQLAAEGKRARAALRRQMIYAVKSMAKVAKDDLALAMKDSVKTMNAF